jgi:heme/copper-type cytochrome/quinol oxidase subunit 1
MDRESSPKRSATIFLQVVIVLIGIGALALMLWEPHLEGRNTHATLFEIYFKDPFLAYAYIASIAFFMALFQAFKLLGYIGQNRAFWAYPDFVDRLMFGSGDGRLTLLELHG